MEVRAYAVNWQRLLEESERNPHIMTSDALFRLMDQGSASWIRTVPSLEENTSANYNSEIGSILVGMVDEQALPEEESARLGAFMAAFCPQVMELEGHSPPVDALLPDVFYAVISPDSLASLISAYDGVDESALQSAAARQIECQACEEVASASEFMNYLDTWRSAMRRAWADQEGLLVFCA